MANFDNGHIKIFRKMLGWEWYDETNTVRVFLHCLLRASWKDNYWRGILVKRGSFITSRNHLAKELNLSEQEIRTALEHLESTNEITKSTSAKYTVITVVKYDDYQTNNQVNNQQTTSKSPTKQPSINQVSTTDEESNKGKNKKNTKEPKPPHRGWELVHPYDAEWWREHHPADGWVTEIVDGVEWIHRVKQ